ncbi:IPT/TIG domain-containing protein [Nocardia gipuzkoensis]
MNFGGTATTFTIDSATQITAIEPGGSGAVQVTVTGSGGISNGLTYTYV